MRSLGCFGLIAFFVLSLVAVSIFNGYVLTVLWGWFVVPTFPNIPALTLVPAIGIAGILRLMTGQYKPGSTESGDEKKLTEEERWALIKKGWVKWADVTFQMFAATGMSLFFGWILHFFM